MKAKGKNIHDEKVILTIDKFDWLFCPNYELTELEIQYGTKTVTCHSNNLSSLIIPDTVVSLNCRENKDLRNLKLPKKCLVHCDKNALADLSIYDEDYRIIIHFEST